MIRRILFLFFLALAVVSLILFSHNQIQLFRRHEAASSLKGPGVPAPANADRSVLGLPWETLPQLHPGVQPEDSLFVRKALRTIAFYRRANQKFFDDRIAKSRLLFREVIEQASSLETRSEAEQEIKRRLILAARERIHSLHLFDLIVKHPDSPRIEAWWSANIEHLRRANQSIMEAVALTGKAILSNPPGVEPTPHTSLLLENLEESAKGILVVSRPAN
jgi:hypothetical protein